MSGSSTYSLLMRCSTSVYTASCGYGRSVYALLPNTVPITSSSMTHVGVVTTRYLIRLCIWLFFLFQNRGGPEAIIAGSQSIQQTPHRCRPGTGKDTPQRLDGDQTVLDRKSTRLQSPCNLVC